MEFRRYAILSLASKIRKYVNTLPKGCPLDSKVLMASLYGIKYARDKIDREDIFVAVVLAIGTYLEDNYGDAYANYFLLNVPPKMKYESVHSISGSLMTNSMYRAFMKQYNLHGVVFPEEDIWKRLWDAPLDENFKKIEDEVLEYYNLRCR